MIPTANAKHLMLRADVRDAVAAGKFNIYPVETIDQGIELLTGIQMGQADAEGRYPPDTISGIVQSRLGQLAEKAGKKEDEKAENNHA